jgi:DNA polymerase-3 subunit beta
MLKETIVKKLKALHMKSKVPNLQKVLIENNTCETTFTTTDLEVWTSVLVTDFTSNPFTALVDYASLVKAIDAVPKKTEVTFSVENNKLTVHTAIGNMVLPSEDKDSFPSLPEIAENTRTDYTTEIIDKLVDLSVFMADQNEIRASLQGICYNAERAELVATNGHYMGIYKNVPEMFPVSTIIGGSGIKPLQKLVRASESYDRKEYAPMAIGSLRSTLTNAETNETSEGAITYSQFSGDDWSITIRSTEGPYPPYWKVIPTEETTTISLYKTVIDNIPIKLLNQATKQVLLTAKYGNVTIFGENSDDMSWNSDCGTGTYEGQVAFNANLLQDIANFVGNNPLVLEVVDYSTAVKYEDADRLALIMPVRLPEPE